MIKRAIQSSVALLLCLALYPVAANAARIKLDDGTIVTYHQSLAALESAIVKDTNVTATAQAGTFWESLKFDTGGTVIFRGGYDAGYGSVVGTTRLEGPLTISSGKVVVNRISVSSARANPVRIIYLHHSTGGNIWGGGVPEFISAYNADVGSDYRITERAYPNSPYPWENYPYDYWKLWVDTTGPVGYQEQDTLDTLADNYDVIMFKHCFPVSDVEANIGAPDIASSRKSLENYELQYNALKARLRQFPNKKFIVWTGASLIQAATTADNAERARLFFNWVKNSWDEKGDNIFVWDFQSLETQGGLYLKPEFSAGDSHPNSSFSAAVAPGIGRRIVDVIEGAGDSGNITGMSLYE